MHDLDTVPRCIKCFRMDWMCNSQPGGLQASDTVLPGIKGNLPYKKITKSGN